MKRFLLFACGLTVWANLSQVGAKEVEPWVSMAPAFEALAARLEKQGLSTEATTLRRELAETKGRGGAFTMDPRFHMAVPVPEENYYALRIGPALEELTRKPLELPDRKDILASVPTPNELANRASEAVGLAWAFTHPQSPRRGDGVLFHELLSRLELVFHGHQGGDFLAGRKSTDNNYNIFPWSGILRAAAMLQGSVPGLLPRSLVADWSAQGKLGVAHQVAKGHETSPTFKHYFNIDSRYMSLLACAAILTGEQALSNRAEMMLDALCLQIYPDGAFPYIYGENASFSYHTSELIDLVEYTFLAKSARASNLVVATTNFYPLSLMTGGVSEYSTVPNWKTTWNAAGLPLGPDMVAAFSRDPQNAHIAHQARRLFPSRPPMNELVLGAICFPAGIAMAPPATNLLVFDRNVQGPRGRFGHFGWTLDGRNRGAEHPGKLTHMSLQITDEPWRYMPLNAALMTVGSRFKFKEGKDTWADLGYATVHEKDTTMFGETFASLSTHYDHVRLSYGQSTSPLPGWEGSQVWLASPRRVLGLVSLETSAPVRALSRSGVIKLGYGAAAWNGTWTNAEGKEYTGPCFIPKKLEARGGNRWSFGKLQVQIHAHDYATVKVRENAGSLRDERPTATELLLTDESTAGESLPIGSRKHYVVEFFPEWEKPSTVTMNQDASGTIRLGMKDEDGSRTLVFNPSAQVRNILLPQGSLLFAPSDKPETLVSGRRIPRPETFGLKGYGHLLFTP